MGSSTRAVPPGGLSPRARRAILRAQALWDVGAGDDGAAADSGSGSLARYLARVRQQGDRAGVAGERGVATAAVSTLLQCVEESEAELRCWEGAPDTDGALMDAAVADRRAGASNLPLGGIPIGVKDIIAVRGMPTLCGSVLEERGVLAVSQLVGSTEAALVSRLRALGCIILGKTKTVEFASGGLGINHVRGTPWNPANFDKHHIPGGSSSGSAASVRAGLCGFAVGSDTGGSVRIPAALCGVVGLKTSVGTWPTSGVLPYSSSFDTLGLLTRSVADAALVWAAVQSEGGVAPPIVPSDLDGVRFGIPTTHFFDGLDVPVQMASDHTLAALRSMGAELVEIDLRVELKRVIDLRVQIVPREFTHSCFGSTDAERRKKWAQAVPFMGSNVYRNAVGLDVTAEQYVDAKREVGQLQRAVADKLTGARVAGLLAPTVPHVAQPLSAFTDAEAHTRSVGGGVGRNVLAGSIWGLCGVSVPIERFAPPGGSARLLPVGMQILCQAGQEERALALGLALEAATPEACLRAPTQSSNGL
eukprot:COSAG01_NODE_7701_length_3092_cov_2.395256_2_plen_533_part_00